MAKAVFLDRQGGFRMPDKQEMQKEQNEFLIEKIKERPINRTKLMRRTLITAGLAVLFGMIACFTILVLEPIISNWLYPEEEPGVVLFPEDPVEMSPEEMLSDTMQELQESKKPQSEQENTELKEQENPAVAVTEDELQQTFEKLLDETKLDLTSYRELYTAMGQFVAERKRCMVAITGTTSNVDWMNDVMESSDQSAGVVIANNGVELLVLADYRSVKKAERLQVTFSEGTRQDAYIKAYDKTTELAVVAVTLDSLSQECVESVELVTLGSSNLRKMAGTPVVALGSPMGFNGTLAYGMVAGEYYVSETDARYKMLLTDMYGSTAAEGFLFNLQGQLVGVLTDNNKNSDVRNLLTGYGISELRKLIEKLSNGTAIPYLGLKGTDVSAEINEELGVPFGAYVNEVAMNSPAMKAGIQQGDVIVTMGGATITGYTDYINALMNSAAGNTMDIAFMRQSQGEYKRMTLSITLGESGKEG